MAERRRRDAPDLNEWEKEFVEGVSERLETYGSAFRDPAKGPLDEALSQRQTQIVRVLDKKTRPKSKSLEASRTPMKSGSGFKRKTPERKGRVRDINEDIAEPPAAHEAVLDQSAAETPAKPAGDPDQLRAGLRVIRGGRSDD